MRWTPSTSPETNRAIRACPICMASAYSTRPEIERAGPAPRPLSLQVLLDLADQIPVEGAAEPPVRGHEDHLHFLFLAPGEEGVVRLLYARGEVRHHLVHLRGEGPRSLDPILGPAELRRRDHLHAFGDLLC